MENKHLSTHTDTQYIDENAIWYIFISTETAIIFKFLHFK